MIKIKFVISPLAFAVWANLGPIQAYLCFPETDMCFRLMGIQKINGLSFYLRLVTGTFE